MNLAATLRHRGVLGINQRNISYTQGENPRHLYPLVDDKLKTKALCEAAGLPVAAVIASASHHANIASMVETLSTRSDFVLKPAKGAMGNGILVIRDRGEDGWFDSSEELITQDELAYHAASIVSGLYALGGGDDIAFAEERLGISEEFERIVYRGVPDIRIIVFHGVPVMAMIRLPTHASNGKANLHQGAVGAGIDLATGRTNFAVSRSRPILRHPDTNESVVGFVIPQFEFALRSALIATDQTGLGYVGADIVIDSKRGPVILELNARPGLAIQLANQAGLIPRLEAIREQNLRSADVETRLAAGIELARSTTS